MVKCVLKCGVDHTLGPTLASLNYERLVEVVTFYPFTLKVGSKYTYIILGDSGVKPANICFNFWTKFPLDNRQTSKARKFNRQRYHPPEKTLINELMNSSNYSINIQFTIYISAYFDLLDELLTKTSKKLRRQERTKFRSHLEHFKFKMLADKLSKKQAITLNLKMASRSPRNVVLSCLRCFLLVFVLLNLCLLIIVIILKT